MSPGNPHQAILSARDLIRGESGIRLLVLLFVGLTVRLVPAYLVYGSFDVGAWELVVREYRAGHNPYETGKLNWPPLWPMLLLVSRKLEDFYYLPTHFSVKIIPCLFDVAIAVTLYCWFTFRTGSPARGFRFSLWYALNPVAIATCALQGQFESIPSFFVLVAMLISTRSKAERPDWGSAIALSLGIMAKTWPVVLVPAFARSVRGLPARWIYVLLCVAPAAIAVYILYTWAPDATLKHVINYRGAPGQWGLTAFNFSLSEQMKAVWSQCVLWLFYLALGIVYVITWRKRDAASVALLALLTFYVFTPDCGTHHHAWILAVALVADFPRARVHLLLATVTLAICYVFAPFNGELFNYIRLRHTPLFWQTNLNETHLRVSGYLFLPLWIYCVWWWSVTLKSIMARREMHREAVVKEQLVRAESRAG